MKPSLLLKKGNLCVPYEVIVDLDIPGFLSQNSIHILRSICDKDTIIERQTMFKYILSTDGTNGINKLINTLQNLSRNYNLYHESRLYVERVFIGYKILNNYVETIEAICDLEPVNTIICNFKNYWCHDLSVIANIKEDLKTIAPILEVLRVYNICLSDSVWVTRDHGSVSFVDEIVDNLTRIGYPTTLLNKSMSTLDIEIDEALKQLFHFELNKINDKLIQYKDLEYLNLIGYLEELDFYLELALIVKNAQNYDIPICYPIVSDKKSIEVYNAYDITLLKEVKYHIIPNDIKTLNDKFFFITGPNSGGKTTYIKCIGINLLLFLCGCPIFASKAYIYPFDSLYTHFPQDEQKDEKSRFEDEVERLEQIINYMSGHSILLCNETFSGTNEHKAVEQLLKLASDIDKLDAFCYCVTHFYSIIESVYPVLGVSLDENDANNHPYKVYRIYHRPKTNVYDIMKRNKMDLTSLMKLNPED